jgi:flagellar hook protein FlgE
LNNRFNSSLTTTTKIIAIEQKEVITMMRSMYSGVSGLRIHQTKMDVIGNNIANVNTVGFKSSRTVFSEVFSQTIQGSSGANENSGGTNPMQIGLGASISSIDVDMTEGAAQRTDNPLDLKIEGDGFFVVSDVTGNKFTRAGAFRIDEAGNLVTPDGKNLMGWTPNEVSGEIEKTKVKALQVLNASNAYVEPSQTEKMVIQGNINKNDPQLAVLPGSPFSVSFFDSLGYKYTAQFYIQETATASEFQFTLPANSITDQDGNTIINDAQNVTVPFDTASGKVTVPPVFELTGLANSATPALTFSEFSDPIEVDVSGLTLFNGNTTVEGVSGDVTFQNPAGLQKIGANLFEVTNNSGDFDGIGEDITSSGGAFNAGVLEMSNVDLSREFTEMITTQRGFQANSRIITSSDEMLQELVNLKR